MILVVEYTDESAAIAAYHERNRAAGLPRKGKHVGRGRHVTIEDDCRVSTLGWTVTCCELADGPDRRIMLIADDQDGPMLRSRPLLDSEREQLTPRPVLLLDIRKDDP